MTGQSVEAAHSSPEGYSEKPVLLRPETTGVLLCSMAEYRAGNGLPPAVGDQVVLNIPSPSAYTYDNDSKRVPIELEPVFEGVYEVIDVREDGIDSPFFTPTGDSSFWGLTVSRIRDIEAGDTELTEAATLVAMM